MRIAALPVALSLALAQPAGFDYYVLSLSWSPDYCASFPQSGECNGQKKFAFVVHGLWPQNERGYPENCPGPAFDRRQVPEGLADVMPVESLVRHEWAKHGTCSGLPQKPYLETVARAWDRITIPMAYRQPLSQVEVAPAAVRRNFARANAGMDEASIRTVCRGRYLSEVRICMTKDLRFRPCGSDVRDTCRASSVIMRPLR
jgi:ribonuclease T2